MATKQKQGEQAVRQLTEAVIDLVAGLDREDLADYAAELSRGEPTEEAWTAYQEFLKEVVLELATADSLAPWFTVLRVVIDWINWEEVACAQLGY